MIRNGNMIPIHRMLQEWLLHMVAVSALLIMLLASGRNPARAQDVTVQLTPDSTHIVIGDFLSAKLTVSFPREAELIISPVTDTLGEMEVVKQSKVDTTIEQNHITFTQQFMVSAYDSGNFSLGPVRLFLTGNDGRTDTLYTEAPLIAVATVPVDTTQAIKPIKSPLSVPYVWQEFIPYIIGGAALLAAIILFLFLRKRWKRKAPAEIERPRPKDPPHIWAMKELKKLEDERLWQKDEVKKYYSRLTDILRLYLEYRFSWPALESTTEQIDYEITGYDIAADGKEKLLGVLRIADMVKFAKRLPMPDENNAVMKNAYAFVAITERKELSEKTNPINP